MDHFLRAIADLIFDNQLCILYSKKDNSNAAEADDGIKMSSKAMTFRTQNSKQSLGNSVKK